MALLGLGVLLSTVLEDDNLLALAVLQDLAFHGSTGDHGSTELGSKPQILSIYMSRRRVDATPLLWSQPH